MKTKRRRIWLIPVAAVAIAGCCMVSLAAVVPGLLVARGDFTLAAFPAPGGRSAERVEQTFSLGEAPRLQITNFAGSVTIRAGERDTVRAIATKRADSQGRLRRIEVQMSPAGGTLVVRTSKPFGGGDAAVDLEIEAPAGSHVIVDTGAGNVSVNGIEGPMEVRSGAGALDVRGARGAVRIDLGAGQITYEGTPAGRCHFQTGAGEIVVRLPGHPNVRIDVGTGLGAVDVDFDVAGRTTLRSVEGVIGNGSQGYVYARTGAGSVRVRRP